MLTTSMPMAMRVIITANAETTARRMATNLVRGHHPSGKRHQLSAGSHPHVGQIVSVWLSMCFLSVKAWDDGRGDATPLPETNDVGVVIHGVDDFMIQ